MEKNSRRYQHYNNYDNIMVIDGANDHKNVCVSCCEQGVQAVADTSGYCTGTEVAGFA